MERILPTNDTPAITWLLAQTQALEASRREREARRIEFHEFMSEACAARHGGFGCPADDQQAQEMNHE